MSTIKKFLNLIFIDGLSGMALGLFSTLIIGTILKQAADLIGGDFGYYLGVFAVMAQRLTGAGIGIGFATGKASEAIARQPEANGQIRTTMMMGLVFIETVIIYALIVAILLIFVL